MTAARALLAVAVSLVLAGCVTPAPSTDAYAAKAGRSAQAAVSAARTALLAEQGYTGGKLTSAYLETTLVDAENSLGSVTTTFDSVQPPDTEAADQLRSQLDPLLQQAGSALTDLRIAARRDDRAAMGTAAGDLSHAADQLDGFAQAHQA